MSRELERTRRYEMSDFPPGTRLLMASRADLDAAIAADRSIKVVGKFEARSGGMTAVPVVYVSKRAQPFHVRYRWWLVGVGSLLVLASIIGWAILSIGLWGFLGLVFAMAAGLIFLNRLSRGGRSVSVTTTTTTNVRVR